MPSTPIDRRGLLALGAASLAGCAALAGDADETAESPLSDRTLFVDDGVDFPAESAHESTTDLGRADAAVLPAAETAESVAVDALDGDLPVVFVGRDAPLHLQRACRADGRRHGIPSTSWSASETVAAARPIDRRIDSQYLDGVELPAELPGAVADALEWDPDGDGASRGDGLPDGVAPNNDPAAWTRVRGRTGVGGYDARDRISIDSDGNAVVATVAAVDADDAVPWRRYDVDGVEISLSFDGREIDPAKPMTESGADVRSERRSGRGDDTDGRGGDDNDDRDDNADNDGYGGGDNDAVAYSFAPEGPVERRRMTIGLRTRVALDRNADSFAYLRNVEFEWRYSGLFDEDTMVAHTPGEAAWRGI